MAFQPCLAGRQLPARNQNHASKLMYILLAFLCSFQTGKGCTSPVSAFSASFSPGRFGLSSKPPALCMAKVKLLYKRSNINLEEVVFCKIL